MRPTRSNILKIALKVRKHIQELARSNKYASHDDKTLMCFCGIASGELWKELKNNGIKSQIASNSNHAFLILEDNTILDITARQFNYRLRNVEVREAAKAQSKSYWTVKYLHDDVESFRTFQKEMGWFSNQWALV